MTEQHIEKQEERNANHEKSIMATGTTKGQRHNWVTDMYDRANLTVRQLNIILIALLTLIVILFVVFGK